MDANDHVRPGARVLARGQAWRVASLAPFEGCAAVRLASTSTSACRTLLTPFDILQPADRPGALRVASCTRLAQAVASTAATAHPFGGLGACAGSRMDILPYQLEPALAVANGTARLLIADTVGLGKTVQAGLVIAELARRSADLRALVAAPAALRGQWHGELAQHFGLSATIASSDWLSQTARDIPADVNPWALPGIYLASFDFLKRAETLRPLEEVAWDLLVVDEAHNAAPGTARLAALSAIACRSRRVVLLTATPYAADREGFESLLRLGAVRKDDPIAIFRRTRAALGAGVTRRSRILAVRLQPAERQMHRRLDAYTRRLSIEARLRGDSAARLAAIVLRKRALSSAGSLAASAARRLALLAAAPGTDGRQLALPFADAESLDDDVPDHVLGAPGLADAGQERDLLAAVHERASAAARAESKLRCLLRLLRRVREPVIVFTEYRDTLVTLSAALRAHGVRTLELHGGQPPQERDHVQRTFSEGHHVLLATDAAAEGLNLQARCRVVIHYELPWTPARLEQRAGRVDRIGQRRRVHEILLVARSTAEGLVLAPLAARAARARVALGMEASALTESRVAAAVLDGEPLPDEPAAGVAIDSRAASDAARAEAERLVLLRALQARVALSRDTDDENVLWLRAPARPRRLCHLTAVYALELVTADAQVVHAQITAVRGPAPPVPPLRTRAALRAWARAWVQQADHLVQARLVALLGPRLPAIAAAVAAAAHAQAEREAAMAAAVPGAARELVQGGLFDRRALRARERLRQASNGLAGAASAKRAGLDARAGAAPRLRLLALVLR